MRHLLRYLPRELRHSIIRKKTPLHDYEIRSEGITVKLANTQAELESAYRLLHDVYAESGLMDPDPSGLRVNIFSTLPYTSVVIAKKNDQVIGTVSLIKDSPIGLPSDKDYFSENLKFRLQGLRLLEVSALAVDSAYRKNTKGSLVSLLMMRYLWQYAYEYMGADTLVAVVHPKTRDFYGALFDFKQNGEIIEYNFVKKALATHLTSHLKNFEKFFQKSKSIYNFFYQDQLPKNLLYPQKNNGLVLHPVMTPELLKYFFIEKTNLFHQLTRNELELINNAYQIHFSLASIELFRFIKGRRHGFRHQSEISALLALGNSIENCQVFDLSPNGAFIQGNCVASPGEPVTLVLNLDNQLYNFEARVVRIAPQTAQYYPKGFGIQFNQTSQKLIEVIQNSHLNKKIA